MVGVRKPLAVECSVAPGQILDELRGHYFDKREEIWQGLNGALQSIQANIAPDKPDVDVDKAIEAVTASLEAFWKRYSTATAARILRGFPHFERALYGLEFEEEGPGRYRDHFLHMFLNFIFGARIISLALKNEKVEGREDEFIRSFFRVAPERGDDLPFGSSYSALERLFFLWGIIATFHDVGVPVENLPKIQSGLEKFLSYFGLEIPALDARPSKFLLTQLDYYIDLLSRFGSGVELTSDGEYSFDRKSHGYMHQVIGQALDSLNQGVMSAIALFRMVTQGFMRAPEEIRGQFPNWKGPFESYVSHILEKDLARAGLAIAFHSLNPSEYPSLFPLSFKKFPLSCFLILCDEVQEYFRPEGISFRPVIKLRYMPKLRVDVKRKGDDWTLDIVSDICYELPGTDVQKTVLEQIQRFLKDKGRTRQFDSFEDYLQWYWSEALRRLNNKIALNSNDSPVRFRLRVWLEEQRGQPVKRVEFC